MKKNNNILIIVIVAIVLLAVIVVTMSLTLFKKMDELEGEYRHGEYNYDDYYRDDEQIDNDKDKDQSEQQEENNGYITRQKALDIALENLNLKQSDVYDINCELDYKYGTTVYEVEFKSGRYEYEFYINAKTGKIIKSFKERD